MLFVIVGQSSQIRRLTHRWPMPSILTLLLGLWGLLRIDNGISCSLRFAFSFDTARARCYMSDNLDRGRGLLRFCQFSKPQTISPCALNQMITQPWISTIVLGLTMFKSRCGRGSTISGFHRITASSCRYRFAHGESVDPTRRHVAIFH